MRTVRVICSSAVAAAIGAVGASQPAWAVVDTVTLTIGHYTPACLAGYSEPVAGSIVYNGFGPPFLSDGKKVYALAEDWCNNRSVLTVYPFPTGNSNWVISLDCGTFVMNRADAQFSHNRSGPGYGSWTWTLPLGFTFLTAGTVVNCTISHN